MLVSCNKEFWHQLASDLSVWLHKGPSIFNLQYMCGVLVFLNKLGLIG